MIRITFFKFMTLFKVGSKEAHVNIMAEVMERLDNSLEYLWIWKPQKVEVCVLTRMD